MKGANEFYKELKKYFTEKELSFEEIESSDKCKRISMKGSGEDLDMVFVFNIDFDLNSVLVISPIPLKVDKSVTAQIAVGIALINDSLIFGNFDFDVVEGDVSYKLAIFLGKSEIDSEIFDFLLSISVNAVEKYNDKILMLAKNMLKLEDLQNFINKR